MKHTVSILFLFISCFAWAQNPTAKTEKDFYEIKTLPIPQDIYLEI